MLFIFAVIFCNTGSSAALVDIDPELVEKTSVSHAGIGTPTDNQTRNYELARRTLNFKLKNCFDVNINSDI